MDVGGTAAVVESLLFDCSSFLNEFSFYCFNSVQLWFPLRLYTCKHT